MITKVQTRTAWLPTSKAKTVHGLVVYSLDQLIFHPIVITATLRKTLTNQTKHLRESNHYKKKKMKFRFSHEVPIFPHYLRLSHCQHHHRRQFVTSFLKNMQRTSTQVRASFNGNSSNSQGQSLSLFGNLKSLSFMFGCPENA